MKNNLLEFIKNNKGIALTDKFYDYLIDNDDLECTLISSDKKIETTLHNTYDKLVCFDDKNGYDIKVVDEKIIFEVHGQGRTTEVELVL